MPASRCGRRRRGGCPPALRAPQLSPVRSAVKGRPDGGRGAAPGCTGLAEGLPADTRTFPLSRLTVLAPPQGTTPRPTCTRTEEKMTTEGLTERLALPSAAAPKAGPEGSSQPWRPSAWGSLAGPIFSVRHWDPGKGRGGVGRGAGLQDRPSAQAVGSHARCVPLRGPAASPHCAQQSWAGRWGWRPEPFMSHGLSCGRHPVSEAEARAFPLEPAVPLPSLALGVCSLSPGEKRRRSS